MPPERTEVIKLFIEHGEPNKLIAIDEKGDEYELRYVDYHPDRGLNQEHQIQPVEAIKIN